MKLANLTERDTADAHNVNLRRGFTMEGRKKLLHDMLLRVVRKGGERKVIEVRCEGERLECTKRR